MLNITILAIGKIKQKYIETAIADYVKRIAPYGKIKIEELKAEKFSERDHEKAKQVEGDRIITYLNKRAEARIIILDELGQTPTSLKFSELVDQEQRPIIFVLGGALGLDDKVKKGYDEHVALSALTLTHEMARLILIEQLYRATTISTKKTYHY